MRDISIVECEKISGALSTSDILNFFRQLGRTPAPPPSPFDPSTVVADNRDVGAVIGVSLFVAGVAGLIALTAGAFSFRTK